MIITRFALTFMLFAVMVAGCQPQLATADPAVALTQAFGTAFAQISQPTNTPIPTETPIPTATVPRTPPALPSIYTTTALNPSNTPHTYIQDMCQYLKAKWDPNNAAPGTIVMVIMFHGVEKGTATVTNPMNIGGGDFKKLMNSLHDMGFQAINTQQLVDFLYNNAKIPPRSVVLIKDDLHYAEDYNDWFRPYWEQWGWPVINAWYSLDNSIRANVLEGNIALETEGWVDHQSHGYTHNINMLDSSTDEFLKNEFEKSIADFQQTFHKTPIAIIWPGGGFGIRPVQFARQYGFRLGFTVNPRGPIMFNWVPQADQTTGQYDIAEGPASDPLMTLPRYWSADAITKLDTVRAIGDQAAAYAEQNKATELEYYDMVCAPTYGSIPAAP